VAAFNRNTARAANDTCALMFGLALSQNYACCCGEKWPENSELNSSCKTVLWYNFMIAATFNLACFSTKIIHINNVEKQ
jgi:hypothetical protein